MGRKEVVKEVKQQLWLAGPLCAVGLLQYSLQVISLMFAGHLGELALSASSIGTSFASVTGFNLLMGLASALETLCGQSYGAGQHHMVGVHMQRAILVLSLTNIFLTVIWANTKSILIGLHQDRDISTEAGRYVLFLIPSLFAYGPLQCLVRFFQTQNHVYPVLVSSAIAAGFHVVVCWSLVFKTGLGTEGAALAYSVSSWVNVIMLGIYLSFSSSCASTWKGFSKEGCSKIFNFIRLALPSALMLCLKVWTFELVLLLAGLLPNAKLEASVVSICLNTAGIVWMIPFGLGASVSTRVSNELGAGNHQAAKLASAVVLCLVAIEGIVVGLVMIGLRRVWGHVYSNEKEVVQYVATMMPILAASSFLDGVQTVLSGIARGCGWQKTGAYINLGSYYFVGLPIAIILGFVHHMKAKGLWLGIVSAFAMQVLLFLLITIKTDWAKQEIKAARRVDDSKAPASITT